MGLLDWWRKRKREQEQERDAMDGLRRADEPDVPVPTETYMSQTRD